MNVDFPDHHYAIVKALFQDGRFLLEGEAAFLSLRENQEFYQKFFWESFRLRLTLSSDYALLQNSRDKDQLSRAICIFVAVICYELDPRTDNLLQSLAHDTFSIEEWDDHFEQSAFQHVLEATDKLRSSNQRRKFYQQLQRRSIISMVDDYHFRFTPAHRYFLDFARELNVRAMLNEADRTEM